MSITGSLASTIGEINPIRYRGYYYDSETGLYGIMTRKWVGLLMRVLFFIHIVMAPTTLHLGGMPGVMIFIMTKLVFRQ